MLFPDDICARAVPLFLAVRRSIDLVEMNAAFLFKVRFDFRLPLPDVRASTWDCLRFDAWVLEIASYFARICCATLVFDNDTIEER